MNRNIKYAEYSVIRTSEYTLNLKLFIFVPNKNRFLIVQMFIFECANIFLTTLNLFKKFF